MYEHIFSDMKNYNMDSCEYICRIGSNKDILSHKENCTRCRKKDSLLIYSIVKNILEDQVKRNQK